MIYEGNTLYLYGHQLHPQPVLQKHPTISLLPRNEHKGPQTTRAKTFQVQINKEMPQKSGRDRDYALTPGHIPPSSCQQLISLHCHLHQESPISPDTSSALLLPSGFYLLPPPAKTQARVKRLEEQERSGNLQSTAGSRTSGLAVYSTVLWGMRCPPSL